jgi:hypothetical protein
MRTIILFAVLCLALSCDASDRRRMLMQRNQAAGGGGGGYDTNCAANTASTMAYYRLDEASGTREDTKNNHDLTGGTAGSATGVIGNCADFTAASSHSLTAVDHANLSGGDFDWSMSVWVKFKSKAATCGLVSKWNSGGNEYILYYDQAADRIKFIWGVTVTADMLGSPAVDTWYHVAVTHNAAGDLLRIRINDVHQDTVGTGGAFPTDGTSPLELGSFTSANFFNGYVDELLIAKELLSAGVITDLYNDGLACRSAGL